MQTNCVGVVVGVHDNSWPGRDGKPGGRRLSLFIQTDRDGQAAPTEVSVEEPDRQSCQGLTFGVGVEVPIEIRPGQNGKLWIRSAGAVKRTASTKAA